MTVTIEKELPEGFVGEMSDIEYQETAERAVQTVLETLHCPYEAEVNILLTGEEDIRMINSEARGIDQVTDVLSFPMHTYNSPADFDQLTEGSFDDFNPETGELLLGDIVLCMPRIKEQALSYGHSFRREYAFLIVHSLLHLVGYDHMNESDETVMNDMQREIMDRLGITRKEQ